MPKDTPQVPRKNDHAPDGESEQCGARAILTAWAGSAALGLTGDVAV